MIKNAHNCTCTEKFVTGDNLKLCFNCFGNIKSEKVAKEKGGIFLGFPKIPEGRERTRMMVRIRDNFSCQDCEKILTPKMAKEIGKRLFDIHHLNGLCGKKSRVYDKVSEIDELITLCHKCHFNRPEHRCKAMDFAGRKWLMDFLADETIPVIHKKITNPPPRNQ